ncbi:MAG: O-methyltransferase [Acidimicrobiales bacterium]
MTRDPKSFQLSPELHAYLLAHGTVPDGIAAALIAETEALGDISRMQVAPEQGALLTLLTAAIGATSAVEVGTFTGYSALCIARGLAPGGRLLACDVSHEWTAIGRKAWEAAGVADRIDLRIAPALETLRSLPQEPTVDLAFIDADKPNYLAYVNELVPRMRPGGLVLLDNVLWAAPSSIPPPTTSTPWPSAPATTPSPPIRVESASCSLQVADGLTILRRLPIRHHRTGTKLTRSRFVPADGPCASTGR